MKKLFAVVILSFALVTLSGAQPAVAESNDPVSEVLCLVTSEAGEIAYRQGVPPWLFFGNVDGDVYVLGVLLIDCPPYG